MVGGYCTGGPHLSIMWEEFAKILLIKEKTGEKVKLVRAARAPAGTQSIGRTFELLKALGARRKIGWRLTDLAAHCGLTVSTTHRIMACLTYMRLARQRSHDRRYVPGPMLFEFALTLPDYFEFQAACKQSLARMAKHTGWVAFLSLRSEDEVVCVDRVGSTSVNVLNEVGRRLPLAGSSMGVAILMALPDREQQEVLRRNRRVLRSNPAHRQRAYEEMWSRSQEWGMGLNLGDIVQGAASVGFVIRGTDGRPVAALGLSGPVGEFTDGRIRQARRILEDERRLIEKDQKDLIAELVF